MKHTTLLIIFGLTLSGLTFGQNASEIVKKAEDKIKGESNYSEMTMTIVRPRWKRTVSFKTCSKDRDYSMTLVTAPAKEKGQTFMKRKNDLWSWNPRISRLVKLPPSMMTQGWMGSDFSNDDVMQESTLSTDYTHKIIGNEKINGRDCYKIELTPKSDAAVIWGKIILWITKKDDLQLKTRYFDDENFPIKTELASQVKLMDGRKIPTKFTLIPEEEPGHKTIVEMTKIKFNISVNTSFFSQQTMKKGSAIRFLN
ncbi:MAG: outer membrane lipoprotein-sorting protein [Bacteroidota bacterium]|nr:outer membrane lipoprotein-sorting protein [Bacteroidota bacterium]